MNGGRTGMRKGINQWSFPDTMSVRSCLEVARDAGFDGLELVLGEASGGAAVGAGDAAHLGSPMRYLGFHPYANDEFTTAAAPDDVRAIKATADALGMRIPSITSVLPFLHPLSSADPGERAQGVQALRTGLEFAGLLGAETLLVVPGVIDAGTLYDEALEHSRESLRSLLPDAEAHGVVLGIENVWNDMLLSPLEFRDFVDGFDSPWVRAYFDVGNVLRNGHGEDWIRILGERIDKVHVCNFRGEVGNLTGFTRHLLDGDVDWPAVTGALAAIGYDGWVTAEVTPPAAHYPEKVIRDISTTMDWILAEGLPAGEGGRS